MKPLRAKILWNLKPLGGGSLLLSIKAFRAEVLWIYQLIFYILLIIYGFTGRLEVVQAARPALHEVPASDASAHITSCALYKDYSSWLGRTCGLAADVFVVVCNASSLLQVPAVPLTCLHLSESVPCNGRSTFSSCRMYDVA